MEIMPMRQRWTWPRDRQAQEECSFLKKRTKKLLFSAVHRSRDSRQQGKSFLLLFFKKEVLALLLPKPSVQFFPLDG
jgi:hypothetical protein